VKLNDGVISKSYQTKINDIVAVMARLTRRKNKQTKERGGAAKIRCGAAAKKRSASLLRSAAGGAQAASAAAASTQKRRCCAAAAKASLCVDALALRQRASALQAWQASITKELKHLQA
jgi:hypothetical protein